MSIQDESHQLALNGEPARHASPNISREKVRSRRSHEAMFIHCHLVRPAPHPSKRNKTGKPFTRRRNRSSTAWGFRKQLVIVDRKRGSSFFCPKSEAFRFVKLFGQAQKVFFLPLVPSAPPSMGLLLVTEAAQCIPI
jgi:hypothetical protein